jgi:hypothetical protein
VLSTNGLAGTVVREVIFGEILSRLLLTIPFALQISIF